jgi:hypothetical protein
MKAQLRY